MVQIQLNLEETANWH